MTGRLAWTLTRPGCGHHLDDGPLECANPEPHEPGHGCIYVTGVHNEPTEHQ